MVHIRPEYQSKTVEQAVAHLAEELNEAATACAKGLRFGLQSVNPELPPSERESNFLWMRREIKDVVGAYRALDALCAREGFLEPGELSEDLS